VQREHPEPELHRLRLPAGSFPGVDQADVFAFLDRHENERRGP
jgi:hypothetical protein